MKTTLKHSRLKMAMMRAALTPALALFLAACANIETPSSLAAAPALEPGFQLPASLETQATAFSSDEVVLNWWEQLNDPLLSELVEAALQHNNDVGIALANLELARTQVVDESLNRRPAINSSVSANEQRIANMIGMPGAGARFTRYEAGFDTSWELDVFGRIGHAIDSAEAQYAASAAAVDGVYVTVAAEVARSYIQLRGLQHRLDVSRRHADNLQQSYEMTQDLLDGGLGNALDVQRAVAQRELIRAMQPALEQAIDASVNRLGVLTGRMPASLRERLEPPALLPAVPPTVNVGEPMDLLKRRPDIRRAEHELDAAVARYQVRVAELYPRISIGGTVGFVATAFSELGSGGTLNHLIGPSISWEIFDRERLYNRVDAEDARVGASLENFEKTLLTSFEEVDNAMSGLANEGERRASLLAAAEASAQAADLALERFEAGSDSFLDVLDAQRSLLDAEDLLAQSETALALNLVQLYKALGGGWELAQQ